MITQVQSPIKNTKGDWFDGPSGQNYSEEYTKLGLLLKRISRDDYNKPTVATHYEYNAKGQITGFWEETLESNPLWGPTGGRIDYEYDPKKYGYIMRDKRIIMGKPMYRRIETSIDSLNRIAIQREYKQDTLLVREQRHKWDIHGNSTEDIIRSRNQPDDRINPRDTSLNNFLRNEFSIELSETEKTLLERSLDSMMHKKDSLQKLQPEWSNFITNVKNKYDNQGRLIRSESHSTNQFTEIVSFSYDTTATQVIRQSYNKTGNLISETISRQHPIHKYILSDTSRHKNGDKWEEKIYNYNFDNVKSPTYQFKYDDHGNWIERKQIDANGKQIGVALVRTIEYYP
ncbi:hypothetical protein GCM10028808_35200 [Spirosoma migulaei]